MDTDTAYIADPDLWIDGLNPREEDHVFAVPTSADDQIHLLQIEIQRATQDLADAVDREAAGGGPELSMADEPESVRLQQQVDALTARIAELAEQRNAATGEGMRVRIRALTVNDYAEIDAESDAARAHSRPGLTVQEQTLRQVAAAFVTPTLTLDQARRLRSKLSAAEWVRLVHHITALTNSTAAEVDLPN